MTGQREAMVAWDPWLAWDRVHGKAKQSMGKHVRHGTAWHGVAWEWAWAWAWQLNNNLQPGRAGRPSLAVSKHGRRAEGESERKDQSVFVCARAMSSDPQLTCKRLGK